MGRRMFPLFRQMGCPYSQSSQILFSHYDPALSLETLHICKKARTSFSVNTSHMLIVNLRWNQLWRRKENMMNFIL